MNKSTREHIAKITTNKLIPWYKRGIKVHDYLTILVPLSTFLYVSFNYDFPVHLVGMASLLLMAKFKLISTAAKHYESVICQYAN